MVPNGARCPDASEGDMVSAASAMTASFVGCPVQPRPRYERRSTSYIASVRDRLGGVLVSTGPVSVAERVRRPADWHRSPATRRLGGQRAGMRAVAVARLP